MFRLANPLFLICLVLPLLLLIWHFWSHRRGRSSILFSGSAFLEGLPTTWRAKLAPHLHWLRYLGLILLIVALARPQTGNNVREITTYGVDIMLVLDVSGTMAELDMSAGNRPLSRLDAAKAVMKGFIEGRSADRIGLIAFATKSLTRCPLTVDYQLVQQALDGIDMNLFPEDMRRTAIGNALATSVARLYESDAKSKIIILLTDGANTAGNIAPEMAADIAESEKIKVYTVGFGSPRRTDVDEAVLQEIAKKTGGQFFRSNTLSDLERVYDRIDELEKSEVVVKNYQIWHEWFPWFLWSGCAVLLLEVVMSQIFCRRVP